MLLQMPTALEMARIFRHLPMNWDVCSHMSFPQTKGGFLPKRIGFPLKSLHRDPHTALGERFPRIHTPLHILFFFGGEKWRNQRIVSAAGLTGCSRATTGLSPLQTKQS